jgi:hypothetical protein
MCHVRKCRNKYSAHGTLADSFRIEFVESSQVQDEQFDGEKG